MTFADRLASARADQRELAWVTHRLLEARDDRARIEQQLAISEQAQAYEQADVDRLTRGVGSLFRQLFADRTELPREQQELAAAQLLCAELADELRAIEVDVAQLTQRARAVANAPARYAALLAELETAARAQGTLASELDAIAATEAELAALRAHGREAVALGITVQQAFTAVLFTVRELHPLDRFEREKLLGEDLLAALTGTTRRQYSDLSAHVADANHGLRRFTHACQALADAKLVEPQLPALPSIESLVFREVAWSNGPLLDRLLEEVDRLSATLSSLVGELKSRDQKLAATLVDCARMRARLLDPAAE